MNYENLELDFIKRTFNILLQYDNFVKPHVNKENYYNHTLSINLLLGVIIVPKEKTLTSIPRFNISQIKESWKLNNSTFNPEIKDVKSLIIALRHSIAHFNIEFTSKVGTTLINKIIFNDPKHKRQIVEFDSDDFFNFISNFTNELIKKIEEKK